MRRLSIIAASVVAAPLLAPPAFAGFGTLAYDETAMKYGLSSNEESQSKADDVAMKECASDKCKIVFRTAARECGAVAMAGSGNGWGAGKHAQKATAELAAMTNCQKHTTGQCKIRAAQCNH